MRRESLGDSTEAHKDTFIQGTGSYLLELKFLLHDGVVLQRNGSWEVGTLSIS